VILPGDITDRDAMLAIGEDLRQRWGRIDIAVLNAGTYEPVTPESFSADLFREHLEVNFMGTVHCIEAVLQDMRKRHSGRIAVVASVTGYAALPKAEAYGATKAALISMADSLRADLAPDGVSVTVIAPGFVRTPLTQQNEFAMPFLIEPERAARIVADGLERGKDEIAFPLRMALAMKGLGMLPGPVARRYVAGVARRRREEGT
jgi:NAD(P)-dependent dehydrogenase (short-subunit alcohol dehydrogenase family)